MSECRYKPNSQLQPLATPEQIRCILNAIRRDDVEVTGKALRYVKDVWRVNVSQFVAAVQAHLAVERRVYQKYVDRPPPGIILLDANIGLFPGSDDEEEDVYVEIRIQGAAVVFICNAHNHERGISRLPK